MTRSRMRHLAPLLVTTLLLGCSPPPQPASCPIRARQEKETKKVESALQSLDSSQKAINRMNGITQMFWRALRTKPGRQPPKPPKDGE